MYSISPQRVLFRQRVSDPSDVDKSFTSLATQSKLRVIGVDIAKAAQMQGVHDIKREDSGIWHRSSDRAIESSLRRVRIPPSIHTQSKVKFYDILDIFRHLLNFIATLITGHIV
uniref:UDPG_MGDP_dh_N domain-containing protein n=1 Tax=Angiostrongylus cantonensis TaxID=6313 RepID=A0A0K0D3V4_ANGCA